MANTPADFTQIFLTYKDVKEANPTWSDKMVEDYLALKQDLLLTAETGDATIEDVGNDSFSMLATLKQQVGIRDALTSDETGFTVDTTRLTADMTEA